MAYASVRGRKPIERASKISHAEIISNPDVQAFLEGCAIPELADLGTIDALLTPIPQPPVRRIKAVVAIDGGYREVAVREQYPSATITFFTFGPLLLELSDLASLDEQQFIAPEDLAKLKRIQRFNLVLPTRNISLRGLSLRRSIRLTLHEFFVRQPVDGLPFVTALRWLLFRQWIGNSGELWVLPNCPNEGCSRTDIVLTSDSEDQTTCGACGGPIYLIDALRLHERVDEDQGAAGILSYVMTLLEHVVLAYLVKTLWELKPAFLREILFIKDGPLAFFGQTAPLSRVFREMAAFLHRPPDVTGASAATTSLLNAVGLEKSGAFVDLAIQIDDQLTPGSALILTNDYIYRYVIPGDPNSPDPYGRNTYWGGKIIYKAPDNNVYVATVPTGEFRPSPIYADFPNLAEILSVVSSLKCSMYDNALVPIALANKLVSLSDFPSVRILEAFAKGQIARPA